MKNNKGFTLIEAIAVTMLLAMLALIIIPTVLNQRRKQEKKIKEQQKKIMYIEAERYLKENNLVEASSTKCIPVTFLEKEGYINLNTTTYDSQYIKLIIDEDENIESSLVNTCSDTIVNKVTVTFDANGGTVDTTSKEVLVGKKYGDLPNPTRSGYTFKWNGKNKFNKDAIPYKAYYYIKGDGTEVDLGEYSLYQINVEPNTTYTITNSGGSTAPGYVVYNSSGTRIAGENFTNRKTVTFTTPSTAKYIRVSIVTQKSSNRYDKEYFQLEEGNKATEYEPYYVTKNTKVTQTGNHTLKAIWEAN